MAEIVLGIGTSHSPQVSAEPSAWPDFAMSDRARPQLDFRGQSYSFAELEKLRAEENFAAVITEDEWQRRHDASQAAIAELSATLAEVAPDVLIIIGDDQDEVIHEDNQPALLVYWGETIYGRPRVYPPGTPAGINTAAWSYGKYERDYPVASQLGRHIIGELIKADFDPASSSKLPEGSAMGHAWGFVYRRLMDEMVIPTIPVMLNTYFPPNQPSPRRCYALGRALRAAVESWPGDERVAVVASGGLTHFVIDEELDRKVLGALAARDADTIASLSTADFVAGSSEILNWIATGGAVEHLEMDLVDYVPSYRSEAGTGCGMAFARWR